MRDGAPLVDHHELAFQHICRLRARIGLRRARPLPLPQLLLRSLPYRLGHQRGKGILPTETEHGTGHGLAANALSRMLRGEVANIAAGRVMHVGASALVAARKRA